MEKLIENGKRVLQENGGDLNDIRLGFHLPPFNSISHLHLHIISPVSQMSFLNRGIFKPNTLWFASVMNLFLIILDSFYFFRSSKFLRKFQKAVKCRCLIKFQVLVLYKMVYFIDKVFKTHDYKNKNFKVT